MKDSAFEALGSAFMLEGVQGIRRLGLGSNLKTIDRAYIEGEHNVVSLPYGEPGFGRRILDLHFDQSTDQASPRFFQIQRQVRDWIEMGLIQVDSAIIHPFCGPKLYASALSDIGIALYVGIDINAYAVSYPISFEKDFKFFQSDVRSFDYESLERKFDVCLFTYEALNSIRISHTLLLLQKLRRVMKSSGKLIVQIRPQREGSEVSVSRSFEECESSVFSTNRHILMEENLMIGRDYSVTAWVVCLSENHSCSQYIATVFTPPMDSFFSILESAGFTVSNILPNLYSGSTKSELANDLTLIALKHE